METDSDSEVSEMEDETCPEELLIASDDSENEPEMQYLIDRDCDENYESENDSDYNIDEDAEEGLDESTFTADVTVESFVSVEKESDIFKMIDERGEAPKSLKRRNDGVINRDPNVRKSKQKKQPDAKQNLPQLPPMPEDLGWSKYLYRRPRKVDFENERNAGPVGVTVDNDPVEVYVNMLKPVLELLIKYSNQKRAELNKKGAKMKDIDYDSMLTFVASLNWMDTRKLPNMREYYCKDDDLNDRFICRLRENTKFGRNQMELVFKTCRLYDKQKCAVDGTSNKKSESFNPEYRYKDVIDAFTLSAQKFFNPLRHVSLDESMDKFTVCL